MSWRTDRISDGPFRAEHIRSGDPYELSNGHPIFCAPTGDRGGEPNGIGYSVVGSDPKVKGAGVDIGYSWAPGALRAPDVSVGEIPNEPGWVKGVPELAIEYADVGQDEEGLQLKIKELIEAGTKLMWVVRLEGLRRVEIHERGKRMRTALPGEELKAPGILANPVLVEALYDAEEGRKAVLRNLLQRDGYRDLDAVRCEGKIGALLAIASARALTLSKKDRARIEGCADSAQLDRWITRAATAKKSKDIFAE